MRGNPADPRWLIVTRLMLELVKIAASSFLDSDVAASDAGDVMLFAAIFIGQVEQRPMTAAKLSQFIGMPRGTVTRRLEELRKRKIVVQLKTGAWVSPRQKKIDRNPAFSASLKHIHKAVAELSKLDSSIVATKQ